MKHVAILTALGLASAALVAMADPTQDPTGARAAHHQAMMEKLHAADTNGDGNISKAEAAAALPMISKHFDEIDTNHDGQLTPDELKAFFAAKHHGGMFKKLDTDGDGRISKAEAQNAPKLAAQFDQLDVNGDGFLTREELRAAHRPPQGGTQ